MADIKSPEQRSINMSHVRGKDTSIEVKVRKYLFYRGFRFRKNDKRYPGKPDIVLPKYKTVIFINGCFWHRHTHCKRASTPADNAEFWQNKFNRTTENDKSNYKQLEASGWNVIVVWECELTKANFETTMQRITNELYGILIYGNNNQ